MSEPAPSISGSSHGRRAPGGIDCGRERTGGPRRAARRGRGRRRRRHVVRAQPGRPPLLGRRRARAGRSPRCCRSRTRTAATGTPHNAPYAGLSTRTGVPEQAWRCPTGTEVLVTGRIHRPAPRDPVETGRGQLRSGRGRARLDRERSDLVATVAHELRSPLTGVKGFVAGAAEPWDKLNDEQKKLMLTTVQRRRRPAQPADRRAARRRPHRHRPAAALPAPVATSRCWSSGSSASVRRRHHAARSSRRRRRRAAARSSSTPTSSPRWSPTWSRTRVRHGEGTVTVTGRR